MRTLQVERVPLLLRDLVPYAEILGIADDLQREQIMEAVPDNVMSVVVLAVRLLDDELDEWLAGPEADDPNPSDEYVACSALRMAVDCL